MSSPVWLLFTHTSDEKAECSICGVVLACKRGSTSALRTHAMKQHPEDWENANNRQTETEMEQGNIIIMDEMPGGDVKPSAGFEDDIIQETDHQDEVPHTSQAGGDESDGGQLAQYPSNADDLFEMKLIDAVEKNQCIYNRCHPLHKMSDYKLHVWSVVAKDVGFSGPGVELERKWRHMRDRYVRLRKLVKTSQPLKKTDKWYFYYNKMSFLDPFVEHRNRRKRGELLNSVMNMSSEQQFGDGGESFHGGGDEDASDSGEEQNEIDPLKGFYASFLNQPLKNITTEMSSSAPLDSLSTPCPPKESRHSTSPSTSALNSTSKRRRIEDEEEGEETEVSLFVRSIQKTLAGMNPQTFAMARTEISRVLYDCQFGTK